MLRKYFSLLVLLMFFIVGCESNKATLEFNIKDDVSKISVLLEKPFGFNQVFEKEEEIRKILNWLKKGVEVDSVESLPAALVKVNVIHSLGEVTSLLISQPSGDIDYTVIKYNEIYYVTNSYPNIIQFEKISSRILNKKYIDK